MHLAYKPLPRTDVPRDNLVLEEYKVIVEESRFVMSRYMQALIIHIALMGFAAKEIAAAPTGAIALTLALAVFVLNFGAYYGAVCFRSMAYHALNRQAVLADNLGIQRPHPMIWGYYLGLGSITISEICLLVFMYLKYC